VASKCAAIASAAKIGATALVKIIVIPMSVSLAICRSGVDVLKIAQCSGAFLVKSAWANGNSRERVNGELDPWNESLINPTFNLKQMLAALEQNAGRSRSELQRVNRGD
jgi:hypothetical protein